MKSLEPLHQDIARFKDALSKAKVTDGFMTAASPGIISTTMLNAHYASHDDYLDAIAREMSKEYQAVHKAGLILQIDAPDLAMDRTMMYRDLSDADFVKRCERHVAAINKGIEGIPRDRVRLHICYGSWEGPHIHDVASIKSCQRSIRPRSARCRSSSPIRATLTNMRRSSGCRSRRI